MKLKRRMDCNRLARQSFGMLNIREAVYFLSYACGKRQKKEVEQNRNFHVCFFFSNLLKVSGTFGVDITLDAKGK